MPSRRRIVVFGDVIDDIVVVPVGAIRPDTDTVSSIRSSPGGSAANTACWMAALGAAVDFVGRVGSDDVARHETRFRSVGVNPLIVGDDTLPTGTIVIIVEGEMRTMLTSTGANAVLSADDVDDSVLDSAALLHFTGYSLFGRADDTAIRRLFDRCAGQGIPVSVDPGSAGFLLDFGVTRFLDAVRGARIIFPNLEEGRLLTGCDDAEAIVTQLVGRFRTVALTLDIGGVLLAARGDASRVIPALPAVRVDPTGAGDAFAAGFLSTWVDTGDDIAAARSGVAAGALAVATTGGRPPARPLTAPH